MEKGHTGGLTLVAQGADPGRIARARVWAALSASDDPVQLAQPERQVHRPEQRLAGQEVHVGGHVHQVWDAQLGARLVLDAGPEPHVRWWCLQPSRRQHAGELMPEPGPPTRTFTPDQLAGRACVYCGAQDQAMRPNEAWGEASIGLFECIDAASCEARIDVAFDVYLDAQEAQSRAEEATAEMFREQERREAEKEAERPVSLDEHLKNEEL